MLEPPKIQLLDFLYGEWGDEYCTFHRITW